MIKTLMQRIAENSEKHLNTLNKFNSSATSSIISAHSAIQKIPQLMAILNITPDSFSDGGKFMSPKTAVQRSQAMITAGASIIDIGGESSRPGAKPVSVDEELRRVVPILQRLCGRDVARNVSTTALVSIDTYKPEVAQQAVQLGAKIINDISGLRHPAMRQVTAKAKCKVIIMHMLGEPHNMQKSPRYKNVVQDIIGFFKTQIDLAMADGIQRKKIIIDPGIGFGKTVDHNLTILKNLPKFKQAFPDLPLLIGASRKSFIGKLTGAEVEDRLPGTLAVHLWAAQHGADILRVHDVTEHAQMLKLLQILH